MAAKAPLHASALPEDYVISGVQVLESETLGQGSYGVVYLGRYRGLLCAVKKLKKFVTEDGLDQLSAVLLRSFYNESEKLCKLRHPNIVQLLGLYQDSETHLPIIVMELMHESLSRLLYRTKTLPLYLQVNILHDVALALAYLHSLRPPIVHRDLSSNNILLSQEFRAKITDLGVAKVDYGSFFNWNNTPAPGTLSYMPPEVRRVPADLSPAMDVFALGVNLLQILTHKSPTPGPEFASGVLGFSKMVSEKERRKDHICSVSKTHVLRPFLLECLKDAPRDRPTTANLCDRLDKTRILKVYVESLQIANIELDQMSIAMQRIATLEQTVEDLSQKLIDKTQEIEELSAKLVEKQERKGRSTSERVYYLHSGDDMQNHLDQTNPHSLTKELEPCASASHRKSRRKLPFSLKRLTWRRRSNGPSGERTKPEGAVCGGIDSNLDINESEDELVDNIDEEFTPKSQPIELHYKQRQFLWTSHDSCLPCGLQGSTLRLHHSNQSLYLCGGAREDGSPNRDVFVSHLNMPSKWDTLKSQPLQYQCASVVVHNHLVLVGGYDSVTGRCTGSLSTYDSQSESWERRLPSMPTARACGASFVSGDYLVVIGGQRGSGELLNTVEVLHIPSHRWETAIRLPESMAGQSVALCGDFICLLGGISAEGVSTKVYLASIQKILSSCRFFSMLAGTDKTGQLWVRLTNAPFPLMTAISYEGHFFALGGHEVTRCSDQPAALLWLCSREEEGGEWSPIQKLPSGCQLSCAAVVPDHRLIVAGGLPHSASIDIAQIQH